MPLNLFKIPIVIPLTRINHGVKNRNMSFVEQDFKVYKGATFNIEFLVRDNDRKPINLVGKSLLITFLNHEDKFPSLQKELKVIDEYKGKARLTLTPADTQELALGYYDYTVLLTNEDSTQELLFTDQDMEQASWMELRDGALPGFVAAVESDPSNWTPFHFGTYPGGVTRYASPNFVGDAQLGFSDGLHTVVFYLDDFTGNIWIQGSLEADAPTDDSDWFTIGVSPNTFELEFTAATGLYSYNFVANVTWVRFVYQPDILNAGSITKILLKA